MMKSLLLKLAYPWNLVYENGEGTETTAGTEGAGTGTEGTGTEGTGTEGKAPKMLTQEQVNKLLAEDRRKHKTQIDQAVSELERAKKSKGLSDKEKGELQGRIEELQNSLLTKEELARKEQERLRNEHKTTLEKVASERDTWQTRYVKATITRSITDEAVKAEAFAPNQIVALLQGATRLVEVLDADGNPIPDEFVAKVRFNDTDKEGKPTTLDLTIPEALKRMKDRVDDFGNLFKSGVTGGLGGSGGRGAGSKGIDPKTATPEEWAKYRKGMGLGRKK